MLPHGQVAIRRSIEVDRIAHPRRIGCRADAVEIRIRWLWHLRYHGRPGDSVQQQRHRAIGLYDQLWRRPPGERDLDLDPIDAGQHAHGANLPDGRDRVARESHWCRGRDVLRLQLAAQHPRDLPRVQLDAHELVSAGFLRTGEFHDGAGKEKPLVLLPIAGSRTRDGDAIGVVDGGSRRTESDVDVAGNGTERVRPRLQSITNHVLAVSRVWYGRNSDRKNQARTLGRIARQNLVAWRAVRRNGKPAHESAVGVNRYCDAVDAERGVSRADVSKNEIRISHGEHLIGLRIGHRYLQWPAHIRNGRELRIRRRHRGWQERWNRHWCRSRRSCRRTAGRNQDRSATRKQPDLRRFHDEKLVARELPNQSI